MKDCDEWNLSCANRYSLKYQPQDIVVISARPYGHRAALKFAKYIGAEAIVGRFTPGTFTNYITRSFKEPRVVAAGLNAAETPAGKPLMESVTVPLNPFCGPTVMVLARLAPCGMPRLAGDAVRV